MRLTVEEKELREIIRLEDCDMHSSVVHLARLFLARHPKHPKRPKALVRCADSLGALANYEEAFALLRRALRICPPEKRYIVYVRMGHLHEQRGAVGPALLWLRRAMENYPSNAYYARRVGSLLSRIGRLKEAEAVLRVATECNEGELDDRIDAWWNLGCVLRAQERWDEAGACFERTLEVSAKFKPARQAMKDIKQVLKSEDASSGDKSGPLKGADKRGRLATLNKVCDWIDEGMAATSFKATWACLGIDGGSAKIQLRHAQSLAAVWRLKEAASAAERAFRLASSAPSKFNSKREWTTGLFYLAILCGTLHRARRFFPAAERWFRKAIELGPHEATGYVVLGALLGEMGRLKEAEEAHRRATKCKNGCIDEAWLNLGLILRGQHRFDEARKCFLRAIQLDPKYKDARRVLGDVEHVLELKRREGKKGNDPRACE